MSVKTPEKDQLSRVLEIIQEIAEKSDDGDYIYRGEPEYYDDVSSTLYRKHSTITNAEHFSIEIVQEEILKASKRYTSKIDDLEILTELQHYGGSTNLIDFTSDCHIALFFACESSLEEDGRIILLRRTNPDIVKPQSSVTRIITQKSIFVQPPDGFIKPDHIINIPRDLKQHVLNHLRRYHGISTETIYNDLHGFIRHQDVHQSAYVEFYTGFTLQNKNEYFTAIEHYNEAIKLNPQHVASYNNRGAAYYILDEYDRAIENYDKALDMDPNQALTYNNRGLSYYKLDAYDKAIEDYDEAIDRDPNHAGFYNNRGNAYVEKHMYDRAIEDYDKAIGLDPNAIIAYNNRGLAYYRLNAHDQAIEDYNKALALNPDYAECYSNRGNSYFQKDLYDQAIKDFDKAIDLNPNSAGFYTNRGNVYCRKCMYDRAIEDHSKAINLNPNDAAFYSNRGICWLHFKKWQEAEEDLNIAKNMGMDIVAEVRNEQGIDFPLPENIRNLLMP